MTSLKLLFSYTLLDLSCAKPLSKITVSDIVAASHSSRQSFYNHFSDKNDLICYTFHKNILATWDVENGTMDGQSYYFCVLDSSNRMKRYKSFLKQAFALVGQNCLLDYAVEQTKQWETRYFQQLLKKEVLPEDLQYAIDIFSYGAVNTQVNWINHDIAADPNDFSKYLDSTRKALFHKYLKIDP